MKGDWFALLQTYSKAAAEKCCEAFSVWCRTPMTIEVNRFEMVPFREVASRVGFNADTCYGVYVQLTKGLQGGFLILLSESSAESLVESTYQKLSPDDQMFQSILLETGNVISCSYLNVLSRHFNFEIQPSPPILLRDLTSAILDSVFGEQAQTQSRALFGEMDFKTVGGNIEGFLMMLPNEEEMVRLLSA